VPTRASSPPPRKRFRTPPRPTAPAGLSATAAAAHRSILPGRFERQRCGDRLSVERCQGAGCTTFAQIAHRPPRASATPGSAQARATAIACAPPTRGATLVRIPVLPRLQRRLLTRVATAPTGLSATAASSAQINLAWTASTDNVGVTGYRVESCQGTGCTTFAQIAARPPPAFTTPA